MSINVFKTIGEYVKYSDFDEKRRLNEREYAKQHPAERIHYIFHGGCLKCVTPLHYGIGNCTRCKYYNGLTSKYPDLSIIDIIKTDESFTANND